MPYLAKEHVDIPSKDLLSWTFDDIKYDWDEPVQLYCFTAFRDEIDNALAIHRCRESYRLDQCASSEIHDSETYCWTKTCWSGERGYAVLTLIEPCTFVSFVPSNPF